MTAKTSNYPSGPLRFAATMLGIAGVLNMIEGIFAIAGDDRFDASSLLFETLTGWGIAFLLLGLLQIYAGIAIMRRDTSGLLLGVTFASLSGIAHFMSLGAYPIWSVTVMVLNFAVLFALLTNDDLF